MTKSVIGLELRASGQLVRYYRFNADYGNETQTRKAAQRDLTAWHKSDQFIGEGLTLTEVHSQ